MNIGILRETKPGEHRVALTPDAVGELTGRGHTVHVETGAGEGIGVPDDAWERAGATVARSAMDVFERSRLLVHVKEPNQEEISLLGPEHILFTYLHLAAYPEVASGLLRSGCTAIAYETVTAPGGGLPLLAPMSRIAGRLAAQAGAHHLAAPHGGKGLLLGGDAGVPPAVVLVVGAGQAGWNAVDVAVGMGASVIVLDVDLSRLDEIRQRWAGRVTTELSTTAAVERWVKRSDVVIGTVLIPGARAPHVVTETTVATMEPGSVVVDVAIDQGGCVATSRETTHDAPTFVKHGVVHYAVGNIPGAVPVTSTRALTAATLPYVMELANDPEQAMTHRPGVADGVNVMDGRVTNQTVAAALEAANLHAFTSESERVPG